MQRLHFTRFTTVYPSGDRMAELPHTASAPIDNAWGTAYILQGTLPVPLSSNQLRVPMLWVHLKVPHRRLPRA